MPDDNPGKYELPKSRRSHPKSRTGCRICKSRKIKCDEQRPSCGNCIKHAVECDFVRAAGRSDALDRPLVASHSPTHGGPAELNLLDLELLFNFTSSTYATLSYSPALRTVWRDTVIRCAVDCDFLMRSVLAVSATHLARLRPEKKDVYTARAVEYHQIASRDAMHIMSTAVKDNAQNLYFFSILTIFFALGSPRKSGGFLLLGESIFPEWMFLVKGTKSLIEILGPTMYEGPAAPMARHGEKVFKAHHSQDLQDAKDAPTDHILDDLKDKIRESLKEEDTTLRVYHDAIENMRGAFRIFVFADSSPVMETTDVFLWMYQVADEFLPLLQVPTQEAVAVFAHFCVLLKRLDSHWWMQGWTDHLMSRAYHLLDREHRLWIRWPIEEVGWAPASA